MNSNWPGGPIGNRNAQRVSTQWHQLGRLNDEEPKSFLGVSVSEAAPRDQDTTHTQEAQSDRP